MGDLVSRIRDMNIVEVGMDVLPYEVVSLKEADYYKSWCIFNEGPDESEYVRPHLYLLPKSNTSHCFLCCSDFSPLSLPLAVAGNSQSGLNYLENKIGFDRDNEDDVGLLTAELKKEIERGSSLFRLIKDITKFSETMPLRSDLDGMIERYIGILRQGKEGSFLKKSFRDILVGGLSFFNLYNRKTKQMRYYASTARMIGRHIGALGFYQRPPYYRVSITEEGINLKPIPINTMEFQRLEKWVGKSGDRRIAPMTREELLQAFGIDLKEYVIEEPINETTPNQDNPF